MDMFCFQCQEAAGGKGCTKVGMCGKSADTANLQDLLIYSLKGLCIYSHPLRETGSISRETDEMILDALFTTITNANFDNQAIKAKISAIIAKREELKQEAKDKNLTIDIKNQDIVDFIIKEEDMIYFSESDKVGVNAILDADIKSLRELSIYGMKGMAAYAMHALKLGYYNEEILKFIERALIDCQDDDKSVDEMIALVLETGKFGVEAMAILDKANTSRYGNPEITEVNIGVRNNPAILISGHDLSDMEQLLEQSKDSGVDIYTHSEMLPANYYPKFKQYPHFVGNYGNAWWKQKSEFKAFNGPILFTTNCIVPPADDYKNRVYTTGSAGHPDFKHIKEDENGKKDFSEIIAQAKTLASPTEIESGTIVGGFAHNQVSELSDTIVENIKNGSIKQFFVMSGCDGRQKGRNYYTEFAEKLPQDTIILTSGCAKYRYNKLKLGDINGIPRVLDAGQCNDSYSLVVTAMNLQKAFGLEDINDLPISYNIAWYEQKAVIVLLALLYLGVKNIKLGPTLPAFLSPNVASVLVNNFGINGIGEIDEDIQQFLA